MNAAELHVPGLWKCPQCGFTQHNNVITATGVFASTKPELRPCPNDGRDMVPVTWRAYAEETEAFAKRLLDEREADQKRLALLDWIKLNVGNIDFEVKTPPSVFSSNPWLAVGSNFEEAIAKAKDQLAKVMESEVEK